VAQQRQKRRAGEKAVEYVNDGDIVGLGTGSTAAAAIDALGDAVAAGYDIHGVPTSFATRDRAIEAGIPLTRIEVVDHIDVAIDGSDEINNNLTLIKGGGAAHAREKVIDATADQFIVVADESKLVETLSEPVPVSTLPMAQKPVKRRLDSLGATTTLRSATMKDGPVITDNGNIVLIVHLGILKMPKHLQNHSLKFRVPWHMDYLLILQMLPASGLKTGLMYIMEIRTKARTRTDWRIESKD
jgi:ribose-5-phosphate isomerase (EC 5.3.1.6)